MNRDQIEGKWRQLRGKVRERWGHLTGDWPHVVAGSADQRAGKTQELYGTKKLEALRQLRDFLRRNRRWNTSSR